MIGSLQQCSSWMRWGIVAAALHLAAAHLVGGHLVGAHLVEAHPEVARPLHLDDHGIGK